MSGEPRFATSAQLAAALTAGAGAVHLAVAGPHFADSWLLGSGFVAVGWAQLAGAAGLIRSAGDRAARWLVSTLNVLSIVVWGLSRTVGLPLGHPGAEAAGTADILTVVFEAVAVAVLIAGPRLATGTRGRHAIVAISIWALPLVGSAFAIASLADGHHGAPSPLEDQAGVSDEPDEAHTHAPGEGH